MKISKKDIERFWSKVDKTSNPNGCWEWKANKLKAGYGKFKFQGKTFSSHRFVFLILRGNIPNKFCVLHKCDNPSCVYPKHLKLGTFKDNMQDKIKKGRANSVKGEKVTGSKLNTSDIVWIREMYATNLYSHQDIALKFQVTRSMIGYIIRKNNWKHII